MKHSNIRTIKRTVRFIKSKENRLKMFWNEWGVSKEDAEIILEAFTIIGLPMVLVLLSSIFRTF